MIKNLTLYSDVYKMGHPLQYPKDTTEIYSYLEARKPNMEVVWFGLQYYLNEYLSCPFTDPNNQYFDEYVRTYENILGPIPKAMHDKIKALIDLRYLPLSIKAIPEGTVINSQNVLMTIRNTHPDFAWVVGYFESLLLKVWNPCTVATYSRKYKKLVEKFANVTCDDNSHVPFQVHDFGYRGVSSEETAQISGAAHLVNFLGSDTISAIAFLNEYYTRENKNTPYGLSVPASEHSVMCAYGRNNEYEAFDNMLELYPEGIVSIVSDTYDLWDILTNYTELRKDVILQRNGKVVFRPDSGHPIKIICGDKDAPLDTPIYKGALQILWEKFGGTTNSKGYKVLNPKVGLIYGDGMYYERFQEMLQTMADNGFASSNLVIGVGGLLLQNHNRDELGFAIKATRIKRGDKVVEIYKDPITDPGKKSKKGLMTLFRNEQGYYTKDQCSEDEEKQGELLEVFRNGQILKRWSIEEIRENANA